MSELAAVWMALLVLICVLAVPAGAKGAAGAAYFVSPDGDDKNAGSEAEPFATLTRARRAIRELKERGLPRGGATVFLRGGVYRLDGTLTLTKADSGTKEAPIRYCACKGEDARITGGAAVPASAFGPVKDAKVRSRLAPSCVKHVLVADLKALGIEALEPWPDSTRNGAKCPELFFNDKPMQVARWPNEGWTTMGKVLDRGSVRSEGRDGKRGGKFTYTGDRPKRWRAAEGVWLTGYWCHDWSDQTIRIKSIDSGNRTITLAAPHGYGLGGKAKRRYYAVNLLEELDAPGEWYLDAKRGLLYFYPPSTIDKASIVLSMLDKPLIELKEASYVTIEGLTLEAVRGSAVAVSGGCGNRAARCLIRNTGGNAVVISGGTDNGVVGCEITQTGAGGIRIDGGDRKTLTPAGNFAEDNHVHHFSRLRRTYAPAVSLNGVGNRMAHNLIHDAPHMAVAFGGNENVMELNEIHDVCQETGDVGVFYTGRDWTVRGNVIRFNFIHHVSGPGVYGAQGIYLDDAASGSIVRGNVLYKVQRAFLIGGGRDNVIEGNLIIDCGESLMFDARGLGWMKAHVGEGGIMQQRLAAVPYQTPPWSTRYPRLVDILDDEPAAPKGNLVRHNILKDSPEMKIAEEVRQFGTIDDNLTVTGAVGFADAKAMDFRLKPGSVVFKKIPEFDKIPFEKVGRRGAKPRAGGR